MTIRFHADFALDLDHITHQLALTRPGWDKRFDDAVKRIVQNLKENPRLYQRIDDVIPGEYRRAPLSGFPHVVIYALTGDEITVLTVLDPARRPLAWLDRTPSHDEP